jgi:TonB family protein
MIRLMARPQVRAPVLMSLAILLQTGGPVGSGKYDTPPKLVSGSAPVYPMSQWRSGKSGFANVILTIGRDGRTYDISVEQASYAYFGSHTIIAVKDWKFEPARNNGQPVPLKVRLLVRFTSGMGPAYRTVRCKMQMLP